MSRRWLIIAGLGVSLFSALSFMPSKIVGAFIKTSDNTITWGGTIWNGFIDFREDGLPPLQFRSHILNPLKGEPFLAFTMDGAVTVRGQGGLNGLTGIRARFPLDFFAYYEPQLRGFDGQIALDIAALSLSPEGACRAVDGHMRFDGLSKNARRLQGWEGPVLSGPLSCVDGDITARLQSDDGTQDITAIVAVSPGGSYAVDIKLGAGLPPEVYSLLPLYDFERQGGNFVLSQSGLWR